VSRGPSGTLARKSLDKRLSPLKDMRSSLMKPPRGWIKAVREALGMDQSQLAKRLGVSQAAVAQFEKQEQDGNVQIKTLKRAAQALDCELMYVLVPRRPLDVVVHERRLELARRQLATIEHSMRLEDQGVEDHDARRAQLESLTEQIKPSELWEDDD
jgi:predicted DNA-binding mobile mystery protein A